jgi:hypothetical protein
MKYFCQITAQRKHRPLYFTSDEQFQWMIAIIQHFMPEVQFDLEGLRSAGKSLGIENPAPQNLTQAPLRPLPATLEVVYGQDNATPNASENVSEKGQATEDENERDEESTAVEGLLTMTDTAQTTPSGRRKALILGADFKRN